MRLALLMFALLLATPAAAQVPDPVPPGFWQEFYAAAKAAGWFGTLAFMLLWWLERGERKDMQTLIMGDPAKGGGGLLEKWQTAFHEVKDALKDVRNAVKP